MEKITFNFMLVILSMAALTFASCSSDDDHDSPKSDIVGIWAENPSFDSEDNSTYEFTSDGRIVWRSYNNKTLVDQESRHYSCSTSTVTATSEENEKVVLQIKSLTSTKLILYNSENNETFSLSKINSLP